MDTTYVAVDVETTGLDPGRDTIIEIAAITFTGANILDEFDSLVNPLCDIPPFITQLTSITDEMVADAPTLHTLRPQLKSRLADHVLVGHNVEFDLGFLREARLAYGNRRIDTLTLASILVPEAGRFSLSALADFLNFPTANERGHRALILAGILVGLLGLALETLLGLRPPIIDDSPDSLSRQQLFSLGTVPVYVSAPAELDTATTVEDIEPPK